MANNHCRRSVSSTSTFLTLAGKKTKQAAAVVTTVLFAFACMAQDQPQPPAAPDSQASATSITIPAGTRIALVLTHPIQSRNVRHGDDIYAQITSPVNSGNEMVLSPGTFVQGTVDKLELRGARAELHLQSMSITFPDGYVAPIPGPATLVSDEGYALKDPGKGRIVGAFALPAAGLGLGALIGHAAGGNGTNINGMNYNPGGLKSTAIGSMVGLAAGGIASLAMLMNSRHFYLDVGSPVEMVLQQPLSLQQDQVDDAVKQSEQHPVAEQPIARRPVLPPPTPSTDHGTCYTPGTPGTPDTVIPGPPGPNGVPGPPTIIPGTPPTPGTPYPCP
jgi:hypothetical protein